MSSWPMALRMARREARRAKGRTALIVAMVGLPVLALTFAITVFASARLTPQEQATRLMGAADGIVSRGSFDVDGEKTTVPEDLTEAYANYAISADDGTHEAATILPHLPPGSGATGMWETMLTMRTPHGLGDIEAYGIDSGSPITTGLTRLISGRMPRAAGEVVASPGALDRLGTTVGRSVTTVDGQRFTVVGVAELGGRIENVLVFQPSTPIDGAHGYWLVTQPGPMSWRQIQELNRQGFRAQSRALLLNPPTQPETAAGRLAHVSQFGLGTVVAGLGLLEVVLLAGPAFTVGARRRQRELALIATNGGTPGMLRRVVLADGVVCGLVAAAAGIATGLAATFLLRGEIERYVIGQRFGGYRVNVWWLVVVVAVGVVTGLLGALVPAFTAARQEVVPALAGRRGQHRSRLRWVLLGAVLVAGGAAMTVAGAYRHHSTIVAGGLCIGEFGLALCTPALLGQIARIGRLLPLTPRIALRDLSRRRATAAPAIAAVMAAVAGSIALSVYLSADSSHPSYALSAPIGTVRVSGTDLAAARAALGAVFPGVATVPVDTLDCGRSPGCTTDPAIPLDGRCPYPPRPDLDAATIRRARADARCNREPVLAGGTVTVVTDDPVVVSAVTGLHGAPLDAAVATLRSGGALVGDPWYVENGKVLLTTQNLRNSPDGTGPRIPGLVPGTPPGEEDISVPAFVVPGAVGALPAILSPAIPRMAGLGTRLGEVLARPSSVPTQAQMDQLQARLSGTAGSSGVETGEHHRLLGAPLLLAIVAAVVALGAAAIATGLAAADSRADLMTLAAVGATPRVRRLLSLAQSGLVAGLGSVLGALAGLGVAAAILTGINQQYASTWPAPRPLPIQVPWTNLLISLVVVPVVAMLGAGLLTRSRLPSERRLS